MRDRNGQALAYIYFEDEPGRRAAAKLLSREAAGAVAELEGLIWAYVHGSSPHSALSDWITTDHPNIYK